jgi:hypothetical protein
MLLSTTIEKLIGLFDAINLRLPDALAASAEGGYKPKLLFRLAAPDRDCRPIFACRNKVKELLPNVL